MNTRDAIRKAIAESVGIPWRQLRLRIVPEDPADERGEWWGVEVCHGGEWQRPPAVWDVSVPRRRVVSRLLELAGRPLGVLVSRYRWFDRCCGGGLRRGIVGMVSGAAGVGKTELTLAVAESFAEHGNGVLFVSMVDGADAVRARLAKNGSGARRRVLVMDAPSLRAWGLPASWAGIAEAIRRTKPAFAVIDGLQSTCSPGEFEEAVRGARPLVGSMLGQASVLFTVHTNLGGDTRRPPQHDFDLHLQLTGGRNGEATRIVTRKNRHGPDWEMAIYTRGQGGTLVESREAPQRSRSASRGSTATTTERRGRTSAFRAPARPRRGTHEHHGAASGRQGDRHGDGRVHQGTRRQ